jgi:Tol biopolymer transport system component
VGAVPTIYTAKADGSDKRALTRDSVYTAEATVSPDGKTIVYTSLRDGDLEIYTMKIDGSNVRRLTHTLGYDGGPAFSPDGKKIVYRAFHPHGADSVQYHSRLAERPS